MKTWLVVIAAIVGFLVIGSVIQVIADEFMSRTTQWMIGFGVLAYVLIVLCIDLYKRQELRR